MSFSILSQHFRSQGQAAPLSRHPYYVQLVDDLEKTRSSMDAIYSKFSNAVDPDLIDCCIFELNAAQKRYKFLLNRVKELSQ